MTASFVKTPAHLPTYVAGQLSSLQDKSVEPIALKAGVAPRTLQEFLSRGSSGGPRRGVLGVRGSSGSGVLGPGRPGWLPTQVPHRSGLAHHAAPGSSSHEFATRGSVVGTWTWFRSRCTCQVSLQRLMRRHPLPSTGSLGLVPPLPRYYEVLRLPAAHFAALRFLRLAISSLRPLFVPPGPGRGAVDQSGVGRRYLQPPCSMETTGSPKFPEEPL